MSNFRLQIFPTDRDTRSGGADFRLKGRFYPLIPVRAIPEMKYF